MSTAPLPTTSPLGTTAATGRLGDRSSLGTTARGAAVGGAGAIVAALAVFAVGSIGAPVRVITGWAPDGADLGAADIVITTIVSVALAAVGLAILDRVTSAGLRIWTISVAAVTVLSFVPLWRLDIDTGSKVALTAMHLLVGAAVIAGQHLVRRTGS